METDPSDPLARNRLEEATSPYLLQHAHQPVHWQPWDDTTLAAARAREKPMLLSVGYATCHWCHVMAHESFDDPAMAALINEHFIPVKVDREERPDLDLLYQRALAATGEHGGWPLTLFLTPDGRPFWGGTYFPPEPRYGRPGFAQVLRGIAEVVTDRPSAVYDNAEALARAVAESAGHHAPAPDADAFDRAHIDALAQAFTRHVDPTHGGLRGAPKFPQPAVFRFLWQSATRTRDPEMAAAVIRTLANMAQGGLYDHLGGGFARYATDERWLVPHFEKMLYDNAQILALMTDVWCATGDTVLEQRVAETADWLVRDMMTPEGAFAAAVDADSEGEEGRYYVWSEMEVDRRLGADAGLFKRVYDVTTAGNWDGRNILHRLHYPRPLTPPEESTLSRCRDTLLAAREQRPPPLTDDKVLADWNGLAIAALARAGAVFDRPDWGAVARGAYEAIRRHLVRGTDPLEDPLAHSARDGRQQPLALLDDYAAMALAALTLYEVEADPAYRTQAEAWMARLDQDYWDAGHGGYFLTPPDGDAPLARDKPLSDMATPSGNALALMALARLHGLTEASHWRRRAEDLLAWAGGAGAENFERMPALLTGFVALVRPTLVTVRGPWADGHTQALRRAAFRLPLPELMVVWEAAADTPRAHLCRGQTCSAPTTDPARLAETARELS